MKTLTTLTLASLLGIGCFTTGCETTHVESTKTGWFGERKHQETTVTENPITGDVNVEKKEHTTR